MSEATPRPWKSGRQQGLAELWAVIGTELDTDIAVDLRQANAELIVRAVNAHDALVDALIVALETITIHMAPDNGRLDWYAQHRYLLETIDAALALAKGES